MRQAVGPGSSREIVETLVELAKRGLLEIDDLDRSLPLRGGDGHHAATFSHT